MAPESSVFLRDIRETEIAVIIFDFPAHFVGKAPLCPGSGPGWGNESRLLLRDVCRNLSSDVRTTGFHLEQT
jgi:hypothetical protein